MDELIIEYILENCEIKGGTTVFFNGSKIYYDVLKKHIGDLFDIKEWEVDNYLITCFLDMDRDFKYSIFTLQIRPLPLGILNGNLFYMDFVYQEGETHNPYYGGIDQATAVGDTTIYQVVSIGN